MHCQRGCVCRKMWGQTQLRAPKNLRRGNKLGDHTFVYFADDTYVLGARADHVSYALTVLARRQRQDEQHISLGNPSMTPWAPLKQFGQRKISLDMRIKLLDATVLPVLLGNGKHPDSPAGQKILEYTAAEVRRENAHSGPIARRRRGPVLPTP